MNYLFGQSLCESASLALAVTIGILLIYPIKMRDGDFRETPSTTKSTKFDFINLDLRLPIERFLSGSLIFLHLHFNQERINCINCYG